MAALLRPLASIAAVLLLAGVSPGADQKQIDAAIQKGVDYLKANGRTLGNEHGIGPTALAGIAMIEAKVPLSDQTLAAIAASVRNASYSQSQTYQIALCIMLLDRLEDPADVPLIQMLAARLLAGQNNVGGWTYPCVQDVSAADVQWLRNNLKPIPEKPGEPKPAVPALHPAVKEYAGTLQNPGLMRPDDNSNTQFAILGVWSVRKHGVPVEAALDRIEKRFLQLQDANGCWSYDYQGGLARPSSAAMTCTGLLGLSTGIARREEKRAKAEPPKEAPPKDPKDTKGSDPFFSPTGKPEEKKERRAEWQTPAVAKGFAGLGAHFVNMTRGGSAGEHPYYTYWSIERVGVIYGVDKVGGIDWYEYLAELLVKSQGGNGAWSGAVDTSFAILILCRANLTRDLSNKSRGSSELRAGNSGAAPAAGGTSNIPMVKNNGPTVPGTVSLPSPKEDESTKMANQLVLAPAADWTKALEKLRDAKGAEFTRSLVIAIGRLDGERKKEAREALADRLTRMTAETLRGMMTAEQAELRRGAALAAAKKDDKAHIPDLIERLLDEDDVVVRAAYAGLKSLTPQDFGPAKGATLEERKAAVAKWKSWWATQKK